MSRKSSAVIRTINPDPVYSSLIMAQFINRIMEQGKKEVARKIVYGALNDIKKKESKDDKGVLELFLKAIENVKPLFEVRSRRVGGATYQVPVEVKERRANALAMRWLIEAARMIKGKSMEDRLSIAIMDAINERGEAIKIRNNTHKMAEANKAFSHYRW